MDLQLFWFVTLFVLLAGYAVLDGFDLGVGIMHLPAARSDRDRRTFMNAIAPVWDGNEVWLITFGGALFAAFPHAYATAFSGLYSAFILVLVALIWRAVSLEFRSKFTAPTARGFFDFTFSAGSVLATILFGVAAANLVRGLPIGADMECHSRLLDLLGPYPLAAGLLSLAAFAAHGCAYLCLKTSGELQLRLRTWFWRTYVVFVVLLVIVVAWTLVGIERVSAAFSERPWQWAGLVVVAAATVATALALQRHRYGRAFLCSAVTIAGLVFLFAGAMYPNLLVSSLNPDWNLTIRNASSSQRSLRIMQIIALAGMPLVLVYSGFVYWTFRGKTQPDESAY